MSAQQKKTRKHYSSRANSEYPWLRMRDQELLDQRICDLGLKIAGSQLEIAVERLHSEMRERGFRFRPHCWLSDDWFSPDGTPGIAVPFYMAHPRLMRLERQQMLEVEGGTRKWCMQILRHEAGHAIDTAYRLHRRKKYRQIFGKYSTPYPEFYRPKPQSKSYVIHLEPNYAQSHPSEDFAETFAVWLDPRSRWRSVYQGWRALKKLEFVDELMAEIQNRPAPIRSRVQVDSVSKLKFSIREHYRRRKEKYSIECPPAIERELFKLFSPTPANKRGDRELASDFLRRNRKDICRIVSRGTGEYRYTINQMVGEIIDLCRENRLMLIHNENETLQNLLVILTVHTVNSLHGGHHRVAL